MFSIKLGIAFLICSRGYRSPIVPVHANNIVSGLIFFGSSSSCFCPFCQGLRGEGPDLLFGLWPQDCEVLWSGDRVLHLSFAFGRLREDAGGVQERLGSPGRPSPHLRESTSLQAHHCRPCRTGHESALPGSSLLLRIRSRGFIFASDGRRGAS